MDNHQHIRPPIINDNESAQLLAPDDGPISTYTPPKYSLSCALKTHISHRRYRSLGKQSLPGMLPLAVPMRNGRSASAITEDNVQCILSGKEGREGALIEALTGMFS